MVSSNHKSVDVGYCERRGCTTAYNDDPGGEFAMNDHVITGICARSPTILSHNFEPTIAAWPLSGIVPQDWQIFRAHLSIRDASQGYNRSSMLKPHALVAR
ncbi:hypothetical protein DICA3_E20340 [Diutina catenulata]